MTKYTKNQSNEKIGYKIRKAQLEKVPYMLVLGAKEQEGNLVAVRSRKDGDIGQMKINEFIEKIKDNIDCKKDNWKRKNEKITNK